VKLSGFSQDDFLGIFDHSISKGQIENFSHPPALDGPESSNSHYELFAAPHSPTVKGNASGGRGAAPDPLSLGSGCT
jgi:hypothetical protein